VRPPSQSHTSASPAVKALTRMNILCRNVRSTRRAERDGEVLSLTIYERGRGSATGLPEPSSRADGSQMLTRWLADAKMPRRGDAGCTTTHAKQFLRAIRLLPEPSAVSWVRARAEGAAGHATRVPLARGASLIPLVDVIVSLHPRTSQQRIVLSHRSKVRAKHCRVSFNSRRCSLTICPALGGVETQLKRSLLSTTSHFTRLV
jgi:hypothetical protein